MKNIKLLVFVSLFVCFNLTAQEEKAGDTQEIVEVVEETKELQPIINIQPPASTEAIVVSADQADDVSEEKKDDVKVSEEVILVEEEKPDDLPVAKEIIEQEVIVDKVVDESVPDESVSDKSVPDKSVPDESVPDKSVAETVDLSEEKIGVQGNWVKKREWVKESYKVNEEIQTTASEIQKLREPFQEKFRTIDGELDSFYKQEGFKIGGVKTLFNSVNRYLDKKRKKEVKKLKRGVTGEEEIKLEFLLRKIKIRKKEIEQLRLDIKSIDQLDKSLNDRLKKLDEHIKLALDESIKSKEMVDEIWYIIDDLKARNIYYQLKGDSLEKVKAIKRYLTGTFSTDYNNFLKVIREQIQKVTERIKELEENGLIIKNRSERLEKIKLEDLENKKTNIEEDEDKKVKRLADRTLGQKIYYFFVDTFAKVHHFLSEL